MANANPTWRLMAVLANCHRDSKRRPFGEDDFLPFPISGKRRNVAPLAEAKPMFEAMVAQMKRKRERNGDTHGS